VALLAGLAHAYVGHRIAGRPAASPQAQRAMGFFAVWWYALALNLLTTGTLYVAAGFGYVDFDLQVTNSYLQRLLLAVSLAGLMYYLLFLLTGRDLLKPLAIGYAAFYVFQVAALTFSQPQGVYVGAWRADLEYAVALPAWVSLLNFAALVVPPVAGALAYFRLYFRVRDRSQRYRIALVSWSLVLWWVVAVAAGSRSAFGSEAFQVFNRFLGLAAALLILMAYAPPAPVRRWLHVQAYPVAARA
jgi:hypothetical protein